MTETTIYSGFCPKCEGRQVRVWRGEPWREGSFAQDCVECGPGVEVEMLPDAPEDIDELVEVWSIDPTVNGTTMIVSTGRAASWRTARPRP